jgi:hypothetical protein
VSRRRQNRGRYERARAVLRDVLGLLVVVLGLVPLLGSRAHAQTEPATFPAATQRYTLTARLDAATHTVHGHVSISLVNSAQAPLSALVFHLYLNAFRDRETVFMRESGGQLRGEDYRSPGSIELKDLRVDGRDLLPLAERELVKNDRTQLRVPLPSPLAVGARVQIESDFVSKLPPVFARSGYEGDFHAVAQWFPKLAKLEPNGTFTSFAYHSLGEFYADFADYTLVLDTPQDYIVGASGELANEQTKGDRTVRRYEARYVHDVAFVASPALWTHRERMGPVDVRVLYPRGYETALPEHLDTLRAGLAHFGASFGPYPYPALTVVIPPRAAEGAAGMEYPTLIVTAGEWLALPLPPRATGAFVTAHELAHQWFYGLVATNELRYPALDEGFTEWASLDLLRSRHADKAAMVLGKKLDLFELERLGAVRSKAPPGLAAYAYARREYGASVYARVAVALESVRRAHGHKRFARAMSEYALKNRFAHPGPTELAAAFDSVYGEGFARRTLLPLVLGGEVSAVHLVEGRTAARGKQFHTRVKARRTGAVSLPTWIAVYDLAGHELARTHFPANVSSLEATFDTSAPVARAVADPDRALLIDPDARDQTIVFSARARPSLLTRLLGLCALVLSWMGP